MNNRCTLIIDGNWLLLSRFAVMKDDFLLTNTSEQLEQARINLVDLMAASINIVINKFDSIVDNIILVQDGGSWRKTISKPLLYSDIDYKGNRIKAEDMSWDHIWGAGNDLCNKFVENGITVSKEYTIEGDDWCWYWSRLLNSKGINTIIWSTDADLKQLINKSDTGAWTVWYNKRNGLVIPNTDNRSEIDTFMYLDEHEFLLNVLKSVVQNNTSIDPQDIVMNKIICGDAGDNIKAVVRVQAGTRINKVSDKEWKSVRESLNISSLDDFFNNKKEIITEIKSLKRFKNNNDQISDLIDVFDYNIIMVYMNESVYPKDILTIMHSYDDKYCLYDLEQIKNNYKVLSTKPLLDDDIFSDINF